MSEPKIAALVCEGHTDVPILRAAIQEVWPELEEVRCLQPELDEMEKAKGPAGWTHVKAWCEAHVGRLGALLEPAVGDPIDLLVVAMDVDIAIEAGIANPPKKGVTGYATPRLRQTILSWLGHAEKSVPSSMLVATPVMAIEAWVIAALFPKEKAAPESTVDPAGWLVTKKKLRTSPKDGKPWKELHLYRDEFAPRVAQSIKRVRKACPEAERLLHAVEEVRTRADEA